MNEAKRKNILFAVVAVVIAVVFFFAGFGTGFGVGKGAAEAPVADAGAAETDGGMLLSSDDDTDRGVSLTSVKIAKEAYNDYDIMPIAETAYTVTATVSGDGLTDEQKGVTWGEAAFKNPSSTWATGKNVSDYVTTTPNGNQLTVQCLKAFGEQIIIKCSSSFNPNVSKDLKVDYKEKIGFESVSIDGRGITEGDDFQLYLSTLHDANVKVNFSHSEASTIKSDVVTAKVEFKPTDSVSYYIGEDCASSSHYAVNVSSDLPTGTFAQFFDALWFADSFFNGDPVHFDSDVVMGEIQGLDDYINHIGKYFGDIVITLSNSDLSIEFDIQIDLNSVYDLVEKTYFNDQASVSGVDFDAPYSDGVIFNQD